MSSLSYLEFKDHQDVEGALPCNSSTLASCNPGGFYCPGDPLGLQCYGLNGRQILSSMSVQYEAVDPDTNVVINTLIVLGIACVFKLAFSFQLIYECNKNAEPRQDGVEVRGPAVGTFSDLRRLNKAVKNNEAAAPTESVEKPLPEDSACTS